MYIIAKSNSSSSKQDDDYNAGSILEEKYISFMEKELPKLTNYIPLALKIYMSISTFLAKHSAELNGDQRSMMQFKIAELKEKIESETLKSHHFTEADTTKEPNPPAEKKYRPPTKNQ